MKAVKIEKMIENIIFKLAWADEDIGYNLGNVKIKCGEIINKDTIEEGSNYAIEFANKIKGWDE